MSDIPEMHSVWQSTEDDDRNFIRTAVVTAVDVMPRSTLVTFIRTRVMLNPVAKFPKVAYDVFTWTLKDFIDSYAPAVEEDR